MKLVVLEVIDRSKQVLSYVLSHHKLTVRPSKLARCDPGKRAMSPTYIELNEVYRGPFSQVAYAARRIFAEYLSLGRLDNDFRDLLRMRTACPRPPGVRLINGRQLRSFILSYKKLDIKCTDMDIIDLFQTTLGSLGI